MTIADSENLMTTQNQSFIMMQHYKEVGFRMIKTSKFIGLGERNGPLLLKEGNYTLFSEMKDFSYDMGYGDVQGYGFHPILLMQRDDGRWLSIYFNQHTSMGVEIRADPQHPGDTLVTFRTIGEDLNMYIHPGSSF
jgi:Glycosyl hydrolases family 31